MSDVSQVQTGSEIENLVVESRSFPLGPAFAREANATTALPDEAGADCVGAHPLQLRQG